MNDKHELFLKAENSPYWIRIFETDGNIFSEDIFSVQRKEAPTKHPSWECAVLKAMEILNAWKCKIDGFEGCISIDKTGWPEEEIAFITLCIPYPDASDYLKTMLSSDLDFDTGWGKLAESGLSMRILGVSNLLQIEITVDRIDPVQMIRNSLTTDEEMLLSNDDLPKIVQELQSRPEYTTLVYVSSQLPRASSHAEIAKKIALLQNEALGKIDVLRQVARSITMDYLMGSPQQYSVIVSIPGKSQRGYYISARSTRELMDKLIRHTRIGPDATIQYSLVLQDEDIILE